jgi:hypothetical protein
MLLANVVNPHAYRQLSNARIGSEPAKAVIFVVVLILVVVHWHRRNESASSRPWHAAGAMLCSAGGTKRYP